MNYNKFYIQFGKLLYAIARSDGKVQDEEVQEFYKIVKRELNLFQESLHGEKDAENSIFSEFEFEQLVFADADQDDAFGEFIKYIRENRSEFSPEMKELCLESVKRVALAYNGIVVQEKSLIDKLKEVFNEEK